MTRLSVNLNKVCLLRNSRGGNSPDPLDAARACIAAGAQGLTLHPRADARHATLEDVIAFAALPEVASGAVELNVEGDLRPELMRCAYEVGAHQFTVVPVMPGEVTSSRGWRAYDDHDGLAAAVRFFNGKLRVSVFCDATETSVAYAARAGADAVEFYTGAFAHAFGTPSGDALLEELGRAADYARSLGLRVHAGHDLDTVNLPACLARLKPDEVSIGHAIIADTLVHGLGPTVTRYLEVMAGG